MRVMSWLCMVVVATGVAGCSKKSAGVNLPNLHPVKGIVNLGGKPVEGGALFIRPDSSQPNLMLSATVGADGRFEVLSMDTQDHGGKKKPGAPEGTYQITYAPPGQDQTIPPIVLAKPFVVEAKANEWTVELNEKK